MTIDTTISLLPKWQGFLQLPRSLSQTAVVKQSLTDLVSTFTFLNDSNQCNLGIISVPDVPITDSDITKTKKNEPSGLQSWTVNLNITAEVCITFSL